MPVLFAAIPLGLLALAVTLTTLSWMFDMWPFAKPKTNALDRAVALMLDEADAEEREEFVAPLPEDVKLEVTRRKSRQWDSHYDTSEAMKWEANASLQGTWNNRKEKGVEWHPNTHEIAWGPTPEAAARNVAIKWHESESRLRGDALSMARAMALYETRDDIQDALDAGLVTEPEVAPRLKTAGERIFA